MPFELCRDKLRPTARTAGGAVPALPETAPTVPSHDPKTGHFLPGNRAARRREVRAFSKGITSINPKAAPEWMRPSAEAGVKLLGQLSLRFPDDDALRPVVGSACDAWVIYRSLLALGAGGDTEALKESRAWLREFRSLMITISSLAGELAKGRDESIDPHAALEAALAAERGEK